MDSIVEPEKRKENLNHVSTEFDLDTLKSEFEACITPDGEVDLGHYIAGYEELDKFLHLLGTVFGWVASDLQAKLEVLRQNRRKNETASKYKDLRSMMKYELAEKMIKFKASDDSSGTRNLLRLHRALEFIVMFMESLGKLENNEKCVAIAQDAYKVTLQKFHPWIVQKAAMLAMHMLPTKEGLVVKVCGDDPTTQEKAVQTFNQAIKAMKVVYDEADKVYKENNLLNLP